MKTLAQHFEYWHNNPPKPFNPDYRPYAKELAALTTQILEANGVYERYTLKERQDLDLWRKQYDILKVDFEAKYQAKLK